MDRFGHLRPQAARSTLEVDKPIISATNGNSIGLAGTVSVSGRSFAPRRKPQPAEAERDRCSARNSTPYPSTVAETSPYTAPSSITKPFLRFS